MMFLNQMTGQDHLRAGPLVLDRVVRLNSAGTGRLTVTAGRVWLTRDGRDEDHVLSPGEQIQLKAGQSIVAEPWSAGATARLTWCADQVARPPAVLRALLARALRGAARRVDLVGERLTACARRAEAKA
jgi:hypothetical protein